MLKGPQREKVGFAEENCRNKYKVFAINLFKFEKIRSSTSMKYEIL